MIYLGLSKNEKTEIISRYVRDNDLKSIVYITGLGPMLSEDNYPFKEIIEYKPFYHLLQTIDANTLLVLNECLRTQNRYDLAYNCVRNFLTQTPRKLIFQYFPFIDQPQDFMILFDFETGSQWKREPFDLDLIRRADVRLNPRRIKFDGISIETSKRTKVTYQKTRQKLFDELGARDPHTIPRNLQLVSTPDKKKVLVDSVYAARNKRFRLDNVITYREINGNGPYTIIDLPHRFIDFSDFLFETGQTEIDVLVADLKVEEWYYNRYQEWSQRLNDFYAIF